MKLDEHFHLLRSANFGFITLRTTSFSFLIIQLEFLHCVVFELHLACVYGFDLKILNNVMKFEAFYEI